MKRTILICTFITQAVLGVSSSQLKVADALSRDLISDLKANEKVANQQRQNECKQEKELLQREYNARKKVLQDDCNADKAERKARTKQIINSIKNAQKVLKRKNANNSEKTEAFEKYVAIMREHSSAINNKTLEKKFKKLSASH